MKKTTYIKDKNFLLLFFGDLISGVGSKIYTFGIALYLLDLTGKASSFALFISIWYIVLFICGPLAATFTDRWENKARVLYISDFARALLFLASAWGIYHFTTLNNEDMTLSTIYVLLVVIGIFAAFFAPAIKSSIPQIVKKEELVSASSIMQITNSIKNIAGLFLGALLYIKFGIVVIAIINAVSFFLSGVSEMFIKIKKQKQADKIVSMEKVHPVRKVLLDLKSSFEYLFTSGKPILTIILIILINSTLLSPWFTVGVPFLFKQYFLFTNYHAEYLIATSQFIESCGIIIASIIIARIASRLKIYKVLRVISIILVGVGAIYFAIIRLYDSSMITSNIFIMGYLTINLILGMVTASVNAPVEASLQKYIRPDQLGKVTMLITGFTGILYPITSMLTGYLLDNYGIYQSLMISFVGFILILIVVYRSKNLTKFV